MSACVLQRPQDQRLLELFFETLTDCALATRERLREFAIERQLPVVVGLARSAGAGDRARARLRKA